MDRIVNYIIVGLGGAAGSMLRYGITLLGSMLNISGCFATFAVNVLGSFLIGLSTGLFKDGTLLLLLTVGFCGGFTTFSTFSMQNVRIFQDGKLVSAMLYIISTVIVCIISAWLGYRLGQSR